MADKKISQLNTLSLVAEGTDIIPIVDTDATETKQISVIGFLSGRTIFSPSLSGYGNFDGASITGGGFISAKISGSLITGTDITGGRFGGHIDANNAAITGGTFRNSLITGASVTGGRFGGFIDATNASITGFFVTNGSGQTPSAGNNSQLLATTEFATSGTTFKDFGNGAIGVGPIIANSTGSTDIQIVATNPGNATTSVGVTGQPDAPIINIGSDNQGLTNNDQFSTQRIDVAGSNAGEVSNQRIKCQNNTVFLSGYGSMNTFQGSPNPFNMTKSTPGTPIQTTGMVFSITNPTSNAHRVSSFILTTGSVITQTGNAGNGSRAVMGFTQAGANSNPTGRADIRFIGRSGCNGSDKITLNPTITIGAGNQVKQQGTHVIGFNNSVDDQCGGQATVIGKGNQVYVKAYAIPQANQVPNQHITVGNYNVVHPGSYNTLDDTCVFGNKNVVQNAYSQGLVALGNNNFVKGNQSVAVGNYNQVYGSQSTAFGIFNRAPSGNMYYSVVLGEGNTVKGLYGNITVGKSNQNNMSYGNAGIFGHGNVGSDKFGFILGKNEILAGGAGTATSRIGIHANPTVTGVINTAAGRAQLINAGMKFDHTSGFVSTTFRNSSLPPEAAPMNQKRGSEGAGRITPGFYTIQVSGDKATLFANVSGTMKRLQLGTLVNQ